MTDPTTTPPPQPQPATAKPPPPAPTPTGPDQTRRRPRRGLGTNQRGRGAAEIINNPTPTAAPPTDTQRKIRLFTVPTQTLKRIQDSGMYRRDLIMTAYHLHSDTIRRRQAQRQTTPGRSRLTVNLSDDEHNRLQRLADPLGWSISATVTVLTELYLNDLDTINNPKTTHPRP